MPQARCRGRCIHRPAPRSGLSRRIWWLRKAVCTAAPLLPPVGADAHIGPCRKRPLAKAAAAAEGCLYRVNPSVMVKPCPRVATRSSRPALRSAKASGRPTAAVAYSATGSAPLRASPQGEAWAVAFDEGALADQVSGPMWASAPTTERRRRSGVATSRAADSRPYNGDEGECVRRHLSSVTALRTRDACPYG